MKKIIFVIILILGVVTVGCENSPSQSTQSMSPSQYILKINDGIGMLQDTQASMATNVSAIWGSVHRIEAEISEMNTKLTALEKAFSSNSGQTVLTHNTKVLIYVDKDGVTTSQYFESIQEANDFLNAQK